MLEKGRPPETSPAPILSPKLAAVKSEVVISEKARAPSADKAEAEQLG